VLRGDEPRRAVSVRLASDLESVPLPDRVVRDALMLSDHLALGCLRDAWRPREIASQELAEWPFADEADPGAVLLVVRRNAFALRDRADLALRQLRQRKNRFRQLLL